MIRLGSGTDCQCERASDSHGVSFVVICRIPDPLAWWNSFQCRPIHADSSSRHCDHAAGVPAPRPAHPDSDRDLETNLNGQGPGRCTLSGPASLCKAQSLLGLNLKLTSTSSPAHRQPEVQVGSHGDRTIDGNIIM